MKEQAVAVNPEEEFKKLREKTGKEELSELKHGMLGGYRRRDVELYVTRLKCQLQSMEKTYKGHIADLTQEKEQLRYERDVLQGRLARQEEAPAPVLQTELQQARRAAEGFLADKDTLEEKLRYITLTADETIEELREKTETLEAELAREHELCDGLQAEKEGLLVQLEAQSQKFLDRETALRRELEDVKCRVEAEQARSAAHDTQMEEAAKQTEELIAQLDVARRNISALLAEKEAVCATNEQMRKALNSLIVKADAVVKENGVVTSMLESERDRVRQYQVANGKLSDLLARVRTANQLLQERITEVDRMLTPPDGVMQAKAPSGAPWRGMADVFDFSEAKDPLKDIVTELNAIQANLAQYQLPVRTAEEQEKKTNIRYSVEKLEVDCTAIPDYSMEGLEEFDVRR